MSSSSVMRLVLSALSLGAACGSTLDGSRDAWKSLFTSFELERIGPAVGEKIDGQALVWTEGPVFMRDSVGPALIFSDTITARIYRYRPETGTTEVLRENSGDIPKDEKAIRAEPGSNGLVIGTRFTNQTVKELYVCQHGAHRIGRLDMATRHISVVGSKTPEGRRLNGPNDVVFFKNKLYFTDPVYAFLHPDKFADLPYLDDHVRNDGANVTGVYSYDVHTKKMALISSDLSRPNGIAFKNETDLVVSDCCQGSHNPTCSQGTFRWVTFKWKDNIGWERHAVLEERRDEAGAEGCADGFAFDRYTNLLVSSCQGGLCVADLTLGCEHAEACDAGDVEKNCRKCGRILARVQTSPGFKVSNIVLAPDGYAYITGSGGIWRLPRVDRTPNGYSHDEL